MTKHNGFGARYDRFTASQVTDEKATRCGGPGVFLPYQHRYCETCKRYVPYRRKAHVPSTSRKGWKCKDCRTQEVKQ